MAHRNLDLTLISAKDLNHVNLISKMEVYAEVSFSGDHRSKQRSVTDRNGGTNPAWNSTLRFTIPVNACTNSTLHVMLHTERALGDREVGEVHIPLKEILGSGTDDGPSQIQFVSYQVRKPHSGKPRGTINLSYKLSEIITDTTATAQPAGYPPIPKPTKTETPVTAYAPTGQYPPPPPAGYPVSSTEKPFKNAEPVTAYPVASSSAPAGAYPPPPPQYNPPPPYGYAPPPQYGYAQAPPPQYGYPGYGYPPAAQPQVVKPKKKKNNNFGLGIGAGLLGGLILGDIVSDAAEDVYDAGYDAGFDDGGGFDF